MIKQCPPAAAPYQLSLFVWSPGQLCFEIRVHGHWHCTMLTSWAVGDGDDGDGDDGDGIAQVRSNDDNRTTARTVTAEGEREREK